MLFNLKIISVEGFLYDGEVSSIVVPSTEGSLGMLANHEHTLVSLMKGTIKIKKCITFGECEHKDIAIEKGILSFSEDGAVILL